MSKKRKLTLYLPIDLIKRAKLAAVDLERSLSSVVAERLEDWLKETESEDETKQEDRP